MSSFLSPCYMHNIFFFNAALNFGNHYIISTNTLDPNPWMSSISECSDYEWFWALQCEHKWPGGSSSSSSSST
jgi:hypothetical protein